MNDTNKQSIKVCVSKSCELFGAKRVMATLEEKTGLHAGESNDTLSLDYCGCLNYCGKAPNVILDDTHIIHNATPETIMEEIEKGGVDVGGTVVSLDDEFFKDI